MNKNNMKKTIAAVLMVMVMVAVLPMALNTFAATATEETVTEAATEEVTVEETTTEETTTEEAATEEVATEETATEETAEETTVDEAATEEVATEETAEETTVDEATTEEVAIEEIATEENITTYNEVYLSGLNVQNSDWEKIEITVTNVNTGETQQGFMDYQSDHALLGYLTSGDCTDTNATYQIEAQVYTADGNVTVVSGYSVGMVGDGVNYSVINFQADQNATI